MIVPNLLFVGKVIQRMVVLQLEILSDHSEYLDSLPSVFYMGYGADITLVILADARPQGSNKGSRIGLPHLLDGGATT